MTASLFGAFPPMLAVAHDSGFRHTAIAIASPQATAFRPVAVGAALRRRYRNRARYVFAAIAAHRAAATAYCAACRNDESDEDLAKKLGKANKTALQKLLTSPPPTTLLGVAALLDHLAQPDIGHDPEDALLAGAIGWEGDIKAAAMKLPAVLAETMRSLIGEQS